MSRGSSVAWLSILCFGMVPAPVAAQISYQIQVESGLVAGMVGADPAVRVFKGIPYAAPPLGELRWRPPQPPLRWGAKREFFLSLENR